MNNFTIRRADKDDSKILTDLVCELLMDFNIQSKSNFNIDKIIIKSTCAELLGRSNFGGFLAFIKLTNQVVGMITITQATAIYNGGDFGVITELYVDRNIRSKGIGKLLLEAAIEFAKQMGWSKVEVGAPKKEDWPRTIDFYKSNGFEEKGPKLRINI